MADVEFVVVENPSVKRDVGITQTGRMAKKLELEFKRLTCSEAADLLQHIEDSTSSYYDTETGQALSFNEASKRLIEMRTTDGSIIPVPELHDFAQQRTVKETLEAQQQIMREMIMSDQGILISWNLAMNGQTMDFRDPSVYEMVFSSNDFFFPVFKLIVKMLRELTGSGDQEKNLRTSANDGRPRR